MNNKIVMEEKEFYAVVSVRELRNMLKQAKKDSVRRGNKTLAKRETIVLTFVTSDKYRKQLHFSTDSEIDVTKYHREDI